MWRVRISGLRQRVAGWRGRWFGWSRPGSAAIAQQDRDLVFQLSRSRIPTGRQLRFLNEVLSPRERIIVQWLTFLAVLAALTLSVSFIGRHIEAVPRAGGTLTEGLVGAPEYINPVLARLNTVETELTALTFRGLMKMDSDFKLTPDLAETVEVSPDGKEYVITLRRGLRWSDGATLTASDVVYTFSTIADAAYKSPITSIFRSVTVAERDARTVVFTLTEPLAPFLSYLTVGILPEDAWIDSTPQTFALSELNLRPIGNGPFRFSKLIKDREGTIKSLEFVRNEFFHGQRPYLDKVITKFYPDRSAAVEALRTHAVDAVGGVDIARADEQRNGQELTQFAVSQLTAVFMNQRSNGALRAKEVRLALAHASSRDVIIDALKGYATPIVGPILPGYLGYNPDLLRYEFDLAKANQILDDAGWKRTESGIRQKGEQQLTFTFHVVDQELQVAVAEALVDVWRDIGANVELKHIEAARMQRDVIRPRSYEALLFGQIFNTDPDPYPFWHSSQQRETGFNLSIFFNAKIDRDLEHGRSTTSNVERATDYFDFQNILAEEIPAIFLFQHHYLYLHPKNLRGFEAERLVTGTDRFQHIETWYLRTWPRWVAEK